MNEYPMQCACVWRIKQGKKWTTHQDNSKSFINGGVYNMAYEVDAKARKETAHKPKKQIMKESLKFLLLLFLKRDAG